MHVSKRSSGAFSLPPQNTAFDPKGTPNMANRTLLLAALLTCLLAPISAPAQTSDVPVTTTIDDYEEAVAPKLHIQSDKKGTYTQTKDVESKIQAIGDWELTTNYTKFSTRSAYLEFSEPIPGSRDGKDPVALPSQLYKARFISKCHEYGNSMFSIVPGAPQPTPCPLIIRFDYGGSSYRIHMNPLTGYYVYPSTNYLNITCMAGDANSQCVQWKIEPSGSYAAADGTLKKRNVGRLVKLVTSKGQTTEVNQGEFYFSFLIMVSKP